MTYLTDINGRYKEIKRDFPMARYAAEIWAGHAGFAQASEGIVRATVSFLEKAATFQRWARLYQADRAWDGDPGPPRGSRLYYASFAGLVAPVRDLIEKERTSTRRAAATAMLSTPPRGEAIKRLSNCSWTREQTSTLRTMIDGRRSSGPQ